MKETTNLVNYLSAVYELEKERCVLERLIQQERSKSWAEIPMPPKVALIPHSEYSPKESWLTHVTASFFSSAVAALIMFVLLFIFGGYFLDKSGMRMGEIASVFIKVACFLGLILFVCMLAFKTKADHRNKAKHDQEQIEIDKKNEKTTALYNQALKLRAAKEQQIKQARDISLHNITVLEQKYSNTKALLQKYYDLNILYISYRGLARVSKYLEYIESGRCSSLQGPHGAYNVCESEIREDIKIENQGIMIQKLSEIVQGIDNVCKSNIMMYRALCDVNQNVTRIQSGFEQQGQVINGIQRDLVALEHNTQAAAYFSETTAKNSKLLTEYAEYQDFALRQKRLEEGNLY